MGSLAAPKGVHLILPGHKTKIVCTIGPSSRDGATLEKMMRAGMNVARLNFSHGDRAGHERDIMTIRSIARRLGRTITILADLPGPKIRIGRLAQEPLILKKGEILTLTTRDISGTHDVVPVAFESLPDSVSKGGAIYINDGAILLTVLGKSGDEVRCKVSIGGPIFSHKGVNLPGAAVLPEPVTKRDLELVDFGLRQGITVFGVSFVEKARDILRVKEFARAKGRQIYTVAKIERSRAVHNIEEILGVTDAIMVARGDLGVEIPIEDVPVMQKKLIRRANQHGRPVITATQMLLSMTDNTRPTRAESTDVANAILDGTDAVMLSEETAVGKYPVDAIRMMGKIASSAERHRKELARRDEHLWHDPSGAEEISDVISRSVIEAAARTKARFILTPTTSGATPRRISRFKPSQWILAFCPSEEAEAFLVLSYGVFPFILQAADHGWYESVRSFLREKGISHNGDVAVLTQGRFSSQQRTTDSLAIITLV